MPSHPARADFDPIPSVRNPATVTVVTALPPVADAAALAVPVSSGAEPPPDLGVDAAHLAVAGFTGAADQTLVVPGDDGRALVALGIGDGAEVGTTLVRDLAAAFARAVPQHLTLAVELPESGTAISAAEFAQAVVEGVLLARWRFFVGRGSDEPTLTALTLVVPESAADEARAGVARGQAIARAAAISRDLANCPATTLTAARMGDVALELGPDAGLEVEVFGEEQLIEMGCGGILGVNLGSRDEPRLVKLSYRPDSPDRPSRPGRQGGHVRLRRHQPQAERRVARADEERHDRRRRDPRGDDGTAGAGCTAAVTAYLCCTDNMPSGSAMKLGDVLRMRNGTTVEVLNTDAEGRLVMADGLCLAVEDGVDAVVDIATLTGACLRTFGVDIAGVMGNDRALVGRLQEAGEVADEPVWELPLHRPYRAQLESSIADLTNMGGVNAGSITAALFLEEFVDGTPWAHVDIAGTAQQPAVRTWRNKGASGFGAKLLIELATGFSAPEGADA